MEPIKNPYYSYVCPPLRWRETFLYLPLPKMISYALFHKFLITKYLLDNNENKNKKTKTSPQWSDFYSSSLNKSTQSYAYVAPEMWSYYPLVREKTIFLLKFPMVFFGGLGMLQLPLRVPYSILPWSKWFWIALLYPLSGLLPCSWLTLGLQNVGHIQDVYWILPHLGDFDYHNPRPYHRFLPVALVSPWNDVHKNGFLWLY